MRIPHIIGAAVIGIAIAIIITTSDSASKYVTFEEAFEMSDEGNSENVHVIGVLKKDKNGKPVDIHYDPVSNPDLCTFTLVDNNQEEQKVFLTKPKPHDLEKCEKVVVEGSVQNGVFVAEEVLMKCPSKYENNKLAEK